MVFRIGFSNQGRGIVGFRFIVRLLKALHGINPPLKAFVIRFFLRRIYDSHESLSLLR